MTEMNPDSKRPMSARLHGRAEKRDWANKRFMRRKALRQIQKAKQKAVNKGAFLEGPAGEVGQIIDIEAIPEEPDAD